jgi:4-hydroxybenzoate polyprenyltransferase
LDLLFITRPVVLVPVWGFVLFGYRISSETRDFFQAPSPQTILLILLFSLSVAAVYVFNQIADKKVDGDNDGFPLLLKSGISDKAAWTWAAILAAMSILIPYFFGYKTISLLSVLSLFIGLIYCFPPFSFSGKPFFDFLSNAFGYGIIAFTVGWILGGEKINAALFCVLPPYFLMMAGGSISSTLPDYDGDKANGKITTAVFLGKRRAHILASVLVVLSAISAFFVSDFVALFASSTAMIFYILYAIFPQNQKLSEACYKVGGGVSMLVIGMFFPILISFGIVIVISSLLYFRFFYKVLYPSLLPAEGK